MSRAKTHFDLIYNSLFGETKKPSFITWTPLIFKQLWQRLKKAGPIPTAADQDGKSTSGVPYGLGELCLATNPAISMETLKKSVESKLNGVGVVPPKLESWLSSWTGNPVHLLIELCSWTPECWRDHWPVVGEVLTELGLVFNQDRKAIAFFTLLGFYGGHSSVSIYSKMHLFLAEKLESIELVL